MKKKFKKTTRTSKKIRKKFVRTKARNNLADSFAGKSPEWKYQGFFY
jgi:hypothetical protein